MDEVLHTIFGTSKINARGYYVITSCKEGNSNKLLHRLIYEKFWGVTLPKQIHIHHKNGNKLDNCILNLEAVSRSEHPKIHFKGKLRDDELSEKISKAKNTTGYYNVSKWKTNTLNQGFRWAYHYFDENHNVKVISSVSLEKLKEKVLEKGLKWVEFDDYN